MKIRHRLSNWWHRPFRCKFGKHKWASVEFVYAAWAECARCGKRAA